MVSLSVAKLRTSPLPSFKMHTHFGGMKNVQKDFLLACVSDLMDLSTCFSNGPRSRMDRTSLQGFWNDQWQEG